MFLYMLELASEWLVRDLKYLCDWAREDRKSTKLQRGQVVENMEAMDKSNV
jgi:ribosome-associated protein YbcJ (S4-like RNA binding protein)